MAKSKKTSLSSNPADRNQIKNSKTTFKRSRKTSLQPRDSPSQRTSIYRGVTRHRLTRRYEAHLWDRDCWNQSQHKKGRQVYLGAYEDEKAAAHTYDLAALKYWGQETILNFPLSTYEKELEEMEGLSKEEYVGSLKRKSSGFSRGVSKYRGVARHHHNGRWEARIGRVFGTKYLYLGTYATQEEAAAAYDIAAIEYRGLNAVTNFDFSRYMNLSIPTENSNVDSVAVSFSGESSSSGSETPDQPPRSSNLDCTVKKTTAPESDIAPPRRTFPDDIQTYFACNNDGGSYGGGDDVIFGELNTFGSPIFHPELDG